MKTTFSVIVFAALLLALDTTHAKDKHSAVPSKVLSARTIFVDNETNDAELQHDAYMGLTKWGRYEIVDAPQKADIILRISGSNSVKFVPSGDAASAYNAKPASASFTDREELAPSGCSKITLIEPKSGTPLWSDIRKTGNAQEKSKLLDGLHDAVDQQERNRSR